MTLTCFDFRGRRAIPGKGARKADLLQTLWQAENDITHFIIAGSAAAGNDKTVGQQRAKAEALRNATIVELLTITKDPK
jgi:hypothetical protein